MSVPLVPIATIKPFSVAYRASSKTSLRSRGSPPLNMRISLLASLVSAI